MESRKLYANFSFVHWLIGIKASAGAVTESKIVVFSQITIRSPFASDNDDNGNVSVKIFPLRLQVRLFDATEMRAIISAGFNSHFIKHSRYY
jgi:hypothetical protein